MQSYLVLTPILAVCVWYSYRVDKILASNTNKRQKYSAFPIVYIPFWPLFLLAWAIVFMLKSMAYGVFIILFAVALTIIRKPFILIWLKKMALKVGDAYLTATSFIFKPFSSQA